MNPSGSSAKSCSTGISGLNQILGGGLPRDRFYVIEGEPGVGKTTLAMQFLLDGVDRGESCLYITLSETREEILSVAESHGWNLGRISILEISAIEQQLAQESRNTLFPASEIELNQTVKMILSEFEKVKPSRVVFDSLSEIRLLSEQPYRYRRQILYLKQYFSGNKCTVFLLDDKTSEGSDAQIQSIAHGVISLESSAPDFGAERHRLKIRKMRGVPFLGGYHDYTIERGGLRVFPRLIASGHVAEFEDRKLQSGIPELDSLLGGGLDYGTSNLFLGPAGSGKSSFAVMYACAAASRGERALFLIFDETLATLKKRAKSLGTGFCDYLEQGLIECLHIDPAELAPGELTDKIREAVTEENVRLVIIDTLNGYNNAMPGERFINLQLHELLTYMNQQGVISILAVAQHGLMDKETVSTVDLSYLADTVILVRYFEFAGQVKKALSVVKKRSGHHEPFIREFEITKDKGIRIGPPLEKFRGIFQGVPVFFGEEEMMLKGKSGKNPPLQ